MFISQDITVTYLGDNTTSEVRPVTYSIEVRDIPEYLFLNTEDVITIDRGNELKVSDIVNHLRVMTKSGVTKMLEIDRNSIEVEYDDTIIGEEQDAVITANVTLYDEAVRCEGTFKLKIVDPVEPPMIFFKHQGELNYIKTASFETARKVAHDLTIVWQDGDRCLIYPVSEDGKEGTPTIVEGTTAEAKIPYVPGMYKIVVQEIKEDLEK